MLRLLAVLLFVSTGCSLARAPIIDPLDTGGVDGGMDASQDAGFDASFDANLDTNGFDGGPDTGVDAGMPDGGMDAGMPDGGMDAGMPDTGVDAGMPDTGVDAPPAPTCASRYGATAGYFECTSATDSECEFYAALGGSSCSTVCTTFGGTCIATYNNAAGSGAGRCTRAGTRSCDLGATDRICVCSAP